MENDKAFFSYKGLRTHNLVFVENNKILREYK